MGKFILVTFLILLSAPASATFYNPEFLKCDSPLVKESGFRTATELNTPIEALGAAVTVEVPEMRCSGSYVSDEGHILLASHCLDSCVKFQTNYWTKEYRDQLTCDVVVNGKAITAKVELMSGCTLATAENRFKADVQGLKTRIGAECKRFIDLAVIKPQTPPEDFNCLPLAKRQPSKRDHLLLLSTPGETKRGVDDADGNKLQLSEGRVIESSKCTVKEQKTLLQKIFSRSVRVPIPSHLQKMFNRWGLLQTNVDAAKGSSGGPLINRDVEVTAVSVLQMEPAHSETRECEGATFFQPVSQLGEAAEAWSHTT